MCYWHGSGGLFDQAIHRIGTMGGYHPNAPVPALFGNLD